MTFDELPVGALFKFTPEGSLLTKVSNRSHDAPQWRHFGLTVFDIDATVILFEPES
jgi:hypothetical protein